MLRFKHGSMDITLSGRDVETTLGCSISQLQIHSSIFSREFFPTGSILLSDTQGSLKNNPVATGDELIITFVNGDTFEASLCTFRVFSFVQIPSTSVDIYRIDFILKCPSLWLDTMSGALTGTSKEVLGQTLNVMTTGHRALLNHGLYTKNAASPLVWMPSSEPSDSMTWRGTGETVCTFMRKVLQHSYLNEGSHIEGGFSLTGRFFVGSVPDLLNATPLLTFTDIGGDGKKVIKIDGVQEISNGGFSEASANKSLLVSADPTRAKAPTSHGKVSVKVNTSSSNVDAETAKGTEVGKISFSPIGTGNTHPHYYEADHQNTRLRSLMTAELFVLATQFTRASVMMPVDYLVKNTSASLDGKVLDPKLSGRYIVTHKTILVDSKLNYYEKIRLSRYGHNVTNPNSEKS